MRFKTETKVGMFVVMAFAIFAYMIFHLGMFHFTLKNYKNYDLYFEDLSGLSKKSDVKIAGVKVGWIDAITLENGGRVKLKVLIKDEFRLNSNSIAEIRQDSILGSKYLEINPGNYDSGLLTSSTIQTKPKSSTSIESLLNRFEKIARNIEIVSEKIAVFSDVLIRNERNIDSTVCDIKNFAQELIPLGENIKRLADRLDDKILPELQSNLEKLSNVFDKDLSKIINNLDSTVQTIHSVSSKIDQGSGLIGKLVNEPCIYDDIKQVTTKFKKLSETSNQLGVVIDSHFESMMRPAENYCYRDLKGYFDLRLHINDDTFFLFEVLGTERGSIRRAQRRFEFFDEKGRPLDQEELNKLGCAFNVALPKSDEIELIRNTTKFGFQLGKIYNNNFAFRFGLFENTIGFAFDCQLPIYCDNLRWVSSLEVFDLRGQDRINDRRPHLKWLNKVFLSRYFYFDFGADDFISKNNANAFFGIGVRFSDEDFRCVFSKNICN